MKLIDRYVYAVTERLPENMREDIKKELYANIEDMLPENPSEEDVKGVLQRLGDPVKLANEYSGTKRYLIGPDVYDSYISVLKLVTGIVAIVFVIITVLEKAVNPLAGEGIIEMTIDIFTNSIGAVLEGIIHGFIWVTLVFVIIERTGVNEGKIPFIKKKWSIDDLPEISVSNRRKISRVETAFGMFFTMLFLIIFYFQPQIIGIYSTGENGLELLAPLIVTERLQFYMPVIIILAFISFIVQVWKFISMKWDIPLAIANTIINLSVCILLFVMIGDESLLNANFIPSIAALAKMTLSEVNTMWQVSGRIFVAVFILANIWDSVSGLINSIKR